MIDAELSFQPFFRKLSVKRDKTGIVYKDIDMIKLFVYLHGKCSDGLIIAQVTQNQTCSAIAVFRQFPICFHASLFTSAKHDYRSSFG